MFKLINFELFVHFLSVRQLNCGTSCKTYGHIFPRQSPEIFLKVFQEHWLARGNPDNVFKMAVCVLCMLMCNYSVPVLCLSVCVCVCVFIYLSASISLELLDRSSGDFVCRSPVTMARSSCGGVVLRYVRNGPYGIAWPA